MAILTGLVFTAATCLYIAYAAKKYRPVAWPIVIGGGIRLLVAWVVGLRLYPVPGSTGDVVGFEKLAATWSQLPWPSLIGKLDPTQSDFYVGVGASLYRIFGRSEVMLSVISAAFGVYILTLTYKLVTRLAGKKQARLALWVIALFPFAILQASMFARAPYGTTLFLLGLLATVEWAEKRKAWHLLLATSFFILATPFHGGYISAVVGLGIVTVVAALRGLLTGVSGGSSRKLISGVVGIVLLGGGAAFALSTGLTVNKLGDVSQLNVGDAIEQRVEGRVSEGRTSYPSALRGKDPFANPGVMAGRIFYFIFSPFPWDIGSVLDIVGFYSSVVYILMAISIYRSRHLIRQHPGRITIFIILAIMFFVYGISIDNSGTAVRHRTKFLYPLLALCLIRPFGKIRLKSYR